MTEDSIGDINNSQLNLKYNVNIYEPVYVPKGWSIFGEIVLFDLNEKFETFQWYNLSRNDKIQCPKSDPRHNLYLSDTK